MNWYLAKIVFQIICGNGQHQPQFDEQLRLIAATDEPEAYAKAKNVGEGKQQSFLNQQQKLVQWIFINVSELFRLDNLVDGAEVYSKIEEPGNPELYISLVNKKALSLQSGNSHPLLQFV